MRRNPVMTPTILLGGRRPRTSDPSPAAVGPVVEPWPKPDHLDGDTATLRAADTIATGTRGAGGLVAGTRNGTMTRTELLTVVKAFRDERGRMQDTAVHQLLTEVVCHLEWDSAAAREDLLRRVKALRDERSRSQDALLMLLLGEIIAALGGEPRTAKDPTRGYCEFCGNEDSGCAVCGGE
jgi:hypothetical protein